MPIGIIYARPWKRVVAAAVGIFAALAGLIASGFTYEIVRDFSNPAVPFRENLLGTLIMSSIAAGGLVFGVRFLAFAISGRSQETTSKLYTIVVGVGCFLPGFAFSLPLTMFWAARRGNDSAFEKALFVSLFVGVLAAVGACVILLRRIRLS
jgi:hypothetical protein